MRHGLVALVFVVALTAPGRGRGPESVKPGADNAPSEDHAAALKLAQEAIDGLKTGGFSGFLDVAFSGNKTSLKKADRAGGETVLGKLYDGLIGRYGKQSGEIDLVRTDAVGRSLVRFVYLEKLERGAVVWHLSFYRGEANEWRWAGFNMGDRLDPEFRPVKSDAIDKDVATLAQQGADGLKAPGTAKLLDTVFVDGKTLIVAERVPAEASFATVRDNITTREGKSLGEVELVRTEAIGQSLVRFVYLEKCERGAAVWKFTFYRTAAGWKWRDLNVGDTGSEFVSAK